MSYDGPGELNAAVRDARRIFGPRGSIFLATEVLQQTVEGRITKHPGRSWFLVGEVIEGRFEPRGAGFDAAEAFADAAAGAGEADRARMVLTKNNPGIFAKRPSTHRVTNLE